MRRGKSPTGLNRIVKQKLLIRTSFAGERSRVVVYLFLKNSR